ncbi:protein translocase subunit SecD [uncultured Senegalimassilia sp.]|uniref:protein translocase subunit SecD n=1 Tax=uncultured Senegalimassilia sp. TaxID=1714350 RepID=UPI0025EBCFA2|nr:protein translocase subunit SecD [uncultured Senegalimassilia sp.]
MAKAQNAKAKKKGGNVNRRNVWLLVLTTVLVLGSIFMFTPPQEKINQGLDIQGGLSVVLSAKSTDGDAVTSEDMEKSRAIIEQRVNALGASEAVVQLQGTDQILVQIPGLSDTETALSTIGKTGKLEFARLDSFTDEDVKTKIENGQYGSSGTITDDFGNTLPSGKTEHLTVEEGTYTPLITGSNITKVDIGRASETGTDYSVNVSLDSEGTKAFADATKDLASTKGKIVIILDGEVQSAPAVQSEITGGQVSITGGYDKEAASSMETVLESGSLPVSFEYAQSQVVGPTLGQDALTSGVLVAAIGLALVMLYLLVFYQGLGLITAAAMAVFAVLYLGILALLSHFGLFSLSMAGIAGVVLTIGMAADSSILTLERFREEIRMGRSVRAASVTGVRHGILTSIDADLVTMVSALTLFFLASASVKGFGLTLALGIICDIVMMLLFKAPIIRLLAPKCIAKHPGFWGVKDCKEAAPYFQGEKPASSRRDVRGRFIKLDINLLGYRKVFLSIAAVAIVLVVALVGVRGVNFGIEFVGGTSVTFHQGGNDVTTEQVRSAFADAGEPDAVVQTTDSDGQAGFLVRTTDTSAESAAAAANKVADQFGWDAESFEVTTIGPDWGASVIQSSCIAFFVSLLLIIAYISVRFRDPKMGVSAVIALLHDLVIVLGVYVLVGREVTPNTIAALLTILGYSLYDTVVVFHRINENMKGDSPKCTFATMANHSVNEVLVRSLNTSITSLIPVAAMLIFGGETLRDFALAMTVGLVCGCYSSYAIATPIYVMWKTREPQFAKLQKKYGADIQRWFLNRLPQAAAAAAAAAGAAAEDAAAGQEAVAAASQGQQAASKPAKAQNRSKKKRKKVQG